MTPKTQAYSDFQTQWTRTPAANSVLPQLAVIPILLTFDRDKLCKIEVECAYQTFVQVDSDLLLYRHLRQHAN
jgi:hypothetical protein